MNTYRPYPSNRSCPLRAVPPSGLRAHAGQLPRSDGDGILGLQPLEQPLRAGHGGFPGRSRAFDFRALGGARLPELQPVERSLYKETLLARSKPETGKQCVAGTGSKKRLALELLDGLIRYKVDGPT